MTLRFLEQLDEAQDQATASGVRQVLDVWQRQGGWLTFGAADETSCFPMFDGANGTEFWPFAIYPRTGSVEVVFQHLARREPFDDPALRHELLDRLNGIDGITLPEAKLKLRPTFRLGVLGTSAGISGITAVLEWFAITCATAGLDQNETGQT